MWARRRALVVAALVAAVVLATPAHAGPTTTQELNQVTRALGQICDMIELAGAIGSEVEAATKLLDQVDIAAASKKKGFPGQLPDDATSNQKGARARHVVEKAFTKRRLAVESESAFRVNGRGRRVDHKYKRILIELKNAARLSSRDIRQFGDYLRKARDGKVVVAIRRGAKISRTKALRLARMMRNRHLVLMSCVF